MSTAGQDPALQLDALVAAGVQERDVFADVTSGARPGRDRPGMRRLIEYAHDNGTVGYWNSWNTGLAA